MPITSKDELWNVVLAAWDTVPQQQVRKLVNSFLNIACQERHKSPKIGKNRVSGRRSPPHGLKVAYFERSRDFALRRLSLEIHRGNFRAVYHRRNTMKRSLAMQCIPLYFHFLTSCRVAIFSTGKGPSVACQNSDGFPDFHCCAPRSGFYWVNNGIRQFIK